MAGDGLVIALSAGEASGDKLAAELVLALKDEFPQARFYGVGGARMAAAGVEIVADYAPLAVIGYWDALRALPRILLLRRRFLRFAAAAPPAVFIGVDAPDFNLNIARTLRGGGCRCVQYVVPSVWMWRRRRLDAIRAAVDAVLCLLPFEKRFCDAAGIRAHYVGHPAARRDLPGRAEARARLGVGEAAEVVALLPGSRRDELARHLPLLAEVLARLPAAGGERCFVAAAADDEAARQVGAALPAVRCGALDDVLAAADVALVKSGTVALECALAGVPMLVFYRMSGFAAWLVRRRRFYLPFFSLPNILSRRFVVSELLVEDATVDNMVAECVRLLNDAERGAMQRRVFARLRETLAAADELPAAALAREIRVSAAADPCAARILIE